MPEYIIDFIEKKTQKSGNPRKSKSRLINKLFKKRDDGSWEICLKDQEFVEAETKYEEHKATKAELGMQKFSFIANVFNGSNELFSKAWDNGEISVKKVDNVEFYSVKKVSSEHTKGHKHEGTLQGVTL